MALDPLTPVRLGVRAARLGVRIGVEAAKIPLRLLSGLLGHDRSEAVATAVRPQPRADEAPAPAAAEQAPAPAPASARQAERPYHPAYEAEVPVEPAPEPPPHVDDEPELVGEFAEPGAGEGAHAELHVDEPWEGYRSLTAAEVRRRIGDAGAEELAVIQLYETTHRRRRTVLGAVERRSKQLANDRARHRPPPPAG
jgi:hypothetical protein